MRVLQRYILADFITSFLMTLSVFTFVMCTGAVIRAIDVATQTGIGGLIAQIFVLSIPYMMTFAIPMSVLTACLILFGRLSFDGELTAMRACGISLWNIIAPVIIVAVLFSVLCAYINTSVAPRCKEMQRAVLRDIGMEKPINLLEAGRFIQDFPNMSVYVRSRSGNNVEDIIVYERDEHGLVSNIRAQRGVLRSDDASRKLVIDLYGVRVDQRDKDSSSEAPKSSYRYADYWKVEVDFSAMSQQKRRKKPSDMVVSELIEKIRDVRKAFPDLTPRDLARQKMFMIVEVNKRFAMALSCFAFALIGIPLGMKSRRKESSVGVGIALGLVFLFYLFSIAANSLVSYPEWRPDMIVWLPVILCEVIGFYLIYRQN